MSEVKYRVCDIDGCNNRTEESQFKTNVIFHTDQTEGRSTEPYFSSHVLDICLSCKNKILETKKYIQGHGAQGHNTYTL